jgi:Kdo2-lipid IVA lauroyltransferase/acyltransferase
MKKFARFCSFLFSLFFQILPGRVVEFFSWALAFLWVDILRIRSSVMKKNLHIAFPGLSLAEQKNIMRKSLFVLVKSSFDLFRIPFLTDRWIDQNIVFHNFDLLKGHEGLFFLSIHMASGDLAAAAISRREKKISLITKRFSNVFVDEFWFSLRTKSQTEFIDAHGKSNAFDILKALRRNRGVAFVLDQFMGKPYGVETLFFNQKTGTAYGLALFVLKTKKPVFPLYSYWGDNGKLNIVIRPAIDLSGLITDDSDIDKVTLTNRFNSELEMIIKQHPDHWMWVHNRWKDFE